MSTININKATVTAKGTADKRPLEDWAVGITTVEGKVSTVEDLLDGTSPLSTATVLAPGASTPRSLAARAGDVANVADEGAALDGVTNDAAAFTAAAAKGKTIYVPGSAMSLSTAVNAQGRRVDCEGTEITGIINNHAGIVGGSIKGQPQSQPVVYPRPVTRRDAPIVIHSQTEDAAPGSKLRRILVAKQNPIGPQKYVRLSFGFNNFTSAASEGGQSEVWRLIAVTDVAIGYVYHVGTPTQSGSWTTASTVATILGNSTVGGALTYYRSTTPGDYLEWANVTTGTKLGIGLFTSATGAATEVLVDGVLVGTVTNDAAAGGAILWRQFDVSPGTHTIRVRHAGAGGENAYIFGINFFEMNASQPGASYDTIKYGWNNTTYPDHVTSTGANEYAIASVAGGKWAGNYHGGETANAAAKWLLDGVDTAFTVGEVKVARSLTIEQDTHVAWATGGESLDILGRHEFHDSGLSYRATATGSVVASSFYTHMATTSPTFTEIVFPRSIDTTDTGEAAYDAATGYYLLGRTNQIIQRHPATGRTAHSWWHLHPYEVTRLGGAAVLPHASYRKVYYGLCEGATRTVTSAAWESVWLFN